MRKYTGDQGKEPYGLEATPEAYIAKTIEILRAIRRVMKDTALLWWNLGDSYASQSNNRHTMLWLTGGNPTPRPETITTRYGRPLGVKPLDLCLIPQQVALAARADGWYVRSQIIWQKKSPMPESVNGWRWERCRVKVGNKGRGTEHFRSEIGGQDHNPDGTFKQDAQWAACSGCPKCSKNDGLVLRRGSGRPTSSYEVVLMMAKTSDYYFDTEAVREPQQQASIERAQRGWDGSTQRDYPHGPQSHIDRYFNKTQEEAKALPGRNIRNVWSIATQPFSLELCKACKRIYDQKHYRRLAKSLDSACSECGGLVAVSTDEWASWYCIDCGAHYTASQVKQLGKRRVCHCGSTDFLSHFAVFPEKLVKPCILSSTSAKGNCPECGMPWARIIDKKSSTMNIRVRDAKRGVAVAEEGYKASDTEVETYGKEVLGQTQTLGWRPTCRCGVEKQEPPEDGSAPYHRSDKGNIYPVVLDPFVGSGTTCVVATRHGRRSIGIDCAKDYLRLAEHRLERTQRRLLL